MDKYVIYGLYCRCHPQRGCQYVGQTREGLRTRFGNHLAQARRGTPSPVYNWIRKHGEESIEGRVLEVADTPDILDALEVEWIATLRTARRGLKNVGPGGNSKALLGASRPEHSERMRGAGNPMYGVDRSEHMAYVKSFQPKNPSLATRALWSKNRTGEGNANSKLTEDEVRWIRNNYTGKRGQLTESSKLFGVTVATIYDIVNRKTWTHL